MNKVLQEDPAGCAIANVACALDISYKKAKELFEKPLRAQWGGYTPNEIVEALKRKGENYSFAKANDRTQEFMNRTGSIVFVKPNKRYPMGHYITRTPEGWMNPWCNFPNTEKSADFERDLPGEPEVVIYKER